MTKALAIITAISCAVSLTLAISSSQVLGPLQTMRFETDVTPRLPAINEQLQNLPRQQAPDPYLLKVIYFIPSNRQPQAIAVQQLRAYVQLAQQFFAIRMDEWGFGPKSFDYEQDAEVMPVIHIVNGSLDDAFYREDLWGRILNEVLPRFSTERSALLVVAEAYKMNLDGRIDGTFAGSAQFNNGLAGWGGVALLGSEKLASFFDAGVFCDMREYHGLQLPEFDDIPLVFGVSFPGFEGPTVGQVTSSGNGAFTHELGHVFGLWHDFRNDENFLGNLMGNGLRGFRGLFADCAPEEFTVLTECDAPKLNLSRFFNRETDYGDNTGARVTITSPQDGETIEGDVVTVTFEAADSGGSGLAQADFVLGGDVQGCMPLAGDEASGAFTFQNLPTGRHTLRVRVFDNQSNEGPNALRAVTVTVRN